MTEKQTLTLPASLERLKIDPKRLEGESHNMEKTKRKKLDDEDDLNPESVLESLSLSGAECPSGTCHCNKRRNLEANILNKTTFKRPILQRSRLGNCFTRKLLRDPVLRLKDSKPATEPTSLNMSNSNCHHRLVENDGATNKIPSLDFMTNGAGKILGTDGSTDEQTDFKCLIANRNSDTVNNNNNCAYKGPSYLEIRTKKEKNIAVPVRRRGAKMCIKCSNIGVVSDTITAPKMQTSSSCSLEARLSSQPDDTTIDELASYFDIFVHIPKKMSHMAEMMYI